MSYLSPRWKGKAKEVFPRQNHTSFNSSGAVQTSSSTSNGILEMQMVGDGMYDAVYTVNMLVGNNQQSLWLQVDTGSSDLWIASNSCSSQACSQTGGHNYNPSSSTPTNEQFQIKYLEGQVSGPIVWDTIQIGPYNIDNQALAAANSVSAEPLSSNFVGVLGLALPLNSIISQLIPPTTGNAADGATFSSNLFSITPSSQAPPAPFISVSLGRPNSNNTYSLLGIGTHPSQVVQDPADVTYVTPVKLPAGTLFWRTTVSAMTVWVNGQPMQVNMGVSDSGQGAPTATLDTGVPYILMTSTLANGIYGALGINPGADGLYYVPCTTPLNMTITLASTTEIPLHPLDLTAFPQSGSNNGNNQYCTGLIQSADSLLSSPSSDTGDMILGVPFLRSAYMVMAYQAPGTDGSFANSSAASTSNIDPRMGLLALTNPTVALEEFHRVRVLNQPLSSNPTNSPTDSGPSGKKVASVGIKVLIGILGFFGLCAALFAIRWFVVRRRLRRGVLGREGEKGLPGREAVYQLARRSSVTHDDSDLPSEDTLRQWRFERYLAKKASETEDLQEHTINTHSLNAAHEFGYKASAAVVEIWPNDDTLVAKGEPQDSPELINISTQSPEFPKVYTDSPGGFVTESPVDNTQDHHRRYLSGDATRSPHMEYTQDHRRYLSSDAPLGNRESSVPLLAVDPHPHHHHHGFSSDLAEFGALGTEGGGERTSMAGVGTALAAAGRRSGSGDYNRTFVHGHFPQRPSGGGRRVSSTTATLLPVVPPP